MEINLHESQWHVKLYLWSRKTWNTFRNVSGHEVQDNLCLYIRSIFLYIPVVFLAHVAFIAWIVFVLFYFPVYQIGWEYYLYEILTITSIALVILGYKRLKRYLDYKKRKMQNSNFNTDSGSVEVRENKSSNLLEVVYSYLLSLKSKICPVIVIARNEELENESR